MTSKLAEQKRKWREKNRERSLEINRKWQRNNPDIFRKSRKAWNAENPHVRRANLAHYRADKLRATPKWVDLKAITQFYKNCPEGHHVDHVIPLRHSLVCGLHVLDNLQYLTALENQIKGNSFDPYQI